jgi:hypothetical protein
VDGISWRAVLYSDREPIHFDILLDGSVVWTIIDLYPAGRIVSQVTTEE